MKQKGHSIISGLESWSGVLDWSTVKFGVKFGGDFGVEFGVKFGVIFFPGGFLESVGCSAE